MNGACVKDGVVGGRCCVTEGTACEKDPGAICVCGVCQCPTGVPQVNGFCKTASSSRDGEMGGKCVQGRCNGTKLRCEDNVCVLCPDKTQARGHTRHL
ncbi:prion-like-(Q/N-rich) domain-bearing protein 25 [Mya arenaria]|uniref:prion-like-(Q/N-rich) domain-bearing protein 25 n=1 Tax=Mya arenaria TaxID=6604 RepID=UPI0022E648EE|nr:prion-like-(Q/N-rich) domain-bearing protein 25 [Mya arenaria]